MAKQQTGKAAEGGGDIESGCEYTAKNLREGLCGPTIRQSSCAVESTECLVSSTDSTDIECSEVIIEVPHEKCRVVSDVTKGVDTYGQNWIRRSRPLHVSP